jgi:hypothetical protein
LNTTVSTQRSGCLFCWLSWVVGNCSSGNVMVIRFELLWLFAGCLMIKIGQRSWMMWWLWFWIGDSETWWNCRNIGEEFGNCGGRGDYGFEVRRRWWYCEIDWVVTGGKKREEKRKMPWTGEWLWLKKFVFAERVEKRRHSQEGCTRTLWEGDCDLFAGREHREMFDRRGTRTESS